MKKLLTIIFFTVLFFDVSAQKDTSATGTTVIFLGKQNSQEAMNYNSSAIKLGIFELASGLYGLYYEHEFSSIFSLQAGAGFTGHNYTQEVIANLKDEESPSNNNFAGVDISDYNYKYDTRSVKMGYFIHLEPKFYYGEDGFDGSYISFIFSKRRYNFDAMNVAPDPVEVNYISENPIHEFENQAIMAIAFGSQTTHEKTILEWNIAGGIRNISGERRDLWFLPDNNSVLVSQATINKVKETQFYFGISFKLGIYWDKKK